MDNKTFEEYQKRMLNAMQNPNKKSNDIFTKLSNILEDLKIFVNNGSTYSKKEFMQEVEKQFKTVDDSDEIVRNFKKTLKDFCSTKMETLKTISELHSMVKPLSVQVSAWSSLASIAIECMTEIEKGIFNPK